MKKIIIIISILLVTTLSYSASKVYDTLVVEGTSQLGGSANYADVEADGTIEYIGDATVWDDIRVVPASLDRPGVSDPDITTYNVGGGGAITYLWQFDKNDIASFTIQMPHQYKVGSDIYAHIHWTAADKGVAENGNTVGWKVDYSWDSIDAIYVTMDTADLSDTCDGADHKHQMTPEVLISGTGKTLSSMIICNVKRTDTGADDTWGDAQGPLLLEIDFHYEKDTLGSRERTVK